MKEAKLQNILFKDELTKGDLIYLLNLDTPEVRGIFHARANQIRHDYFRDEVHFRGVIEISNYCSQNCNYCGLRDENYSIKRFKMEPD